MDWEAFEGTKDFEEGKRGPNAAYCSSKLANVLFGTKLAEKLQVSNSFVFIARIKQNLSLFLILESRSKCLYRLPRVELY